MNGERRQSLAARLLQDSLCVLLVPAIMVAVYTLAVSLSYGVALWKLDDVLPTLLWLSILAFPVLIVLGLPSSGSAREVNRKLLVTFTGSWAFAAFLASLVLWPALSR
jgi:uncharacterized membrane protein